MKNDTATPLQIPEASTHDVLTEILRDGAREMLGKAIEAEVADYIATHAHERDADGHRLVVRNGHASERELQTGLFDRLVVAALDSKAVTYKELTAGAT